MLRKVLLLYITAVGTIVSFSLLDPRDQVFIYNPREALNQEAKLVTTEGAFDVQTPATPANEPAAGNIEPENSQNTNTEPQSSLAQKTPEPTPNPAPAPSEKISTPEKFSLLQSRIRSKDDTTGAYEESYKNALHFLDLIQNGTKNLIINNANQTRPNQNAEEASP